MGIISKSDFEQLFKTHFASLCSFAFKYLRDFDTSKEIVHDVFINLWEKRESIDKEKSITSYLFSSVRNRCLNHIRDQKKFDKTIDTAKVLLQQSSNQTSDTIIADELENEIILILNELPPKCREIFFLNRFNGMKYKEIAEQLSLSIKTVETQMSKALKIFKENLSEYL